MAHFYAVAQPIARLIIVFQYKISANSDTCKINISPIYKQ